MTSIFEGQPPKTRPVGVIWVLGGGKYLKWRKKTCDEAEGFGKERTDGLHVRKLQQKQKNMEKVYTHQHIWIDPTFIF